jgi:regulatory protein
VRFSQKLTKEQAYQKIKQYCAYQERCHKEVREKLYGYGLYKSEVEEILVNLIEEEYLNEERFAIGFAGGKFRMKHWGRNKILYELKQKQVSPYCIKVALQAIDESDYLASLQKLAVKKWESLEKENNLSRQAKVYAYLLQKGYEPNKITEAIAPLKTSKTS